MKNGGVKQLAKQRRSGFEVRADVETVVLVS